MLLHLKIWLMFIKCFDIVRLRNVLQNPLIWYPRRKKSTEFFQSVQIFPTAFVRIFEKVIWEHWCGGLVFLLAALFSIDKPSQLKPAQCRANLSQFGVPWLGLGLRCIPNLKWKWSDMFRVMDPNWSNFWERSWNLITDQSSGNTGVTSRTARWSSAFTKNMWLLEHCMSMEWWQKWFARCWNRFV